MLFDFSNEENKVQKGKIINTEIIVKTKYKQNKKEQKYCELSNSIS